MNIIRLKWQKLRNNRCIRSIYYFINGLLGKIPFIKNLAIRISINRFREYKKYNKSYLYWENLYSCGGNSGAGSYGKYARLKGNVLNKFVKEKSIESIIEFGFGDGNQLSYYNFPSYIGLDVAKSALSKCKSKFRKDKTKSFHLYKPYSSKNKSKILRADLSISMDVIYHLTEDSIYIKYMNDLFASAKKYVIIYSTDFDQTKTIKTWMRHRKFTKYIMENFPEWKLIKKINNPYKIIYSDFFIYKRNRD